MIKNSLKNYFKCLAHVFVPLGCLFLGVLFGLNHFFGVLSAQTSYLSEEIVRIIPEVEADFDEIWSYILASARELSWEQPFETVKLLLDGNWLAEKIAAVTGMTAEQYNKFLLDVQTVLENVGNELIGGAVIFVVFVVLSIWLGFFVTNLFVRRTTVKRGFLKFVAVTLLDSFLSATLIAFTTWILSLWSWGGVFSSVVSLLVFGFVALLEAYVIHGGRKIAFFKVVNLKNCCLLLFSQLIIFVISLVIILLFFLVTNALAALAVGLSVFVIAMLVSGVNAESYVVHIMRQEQESAGEETPESA